MKRPIRIMTLFPNVGAALLTDRRDHHDRKRKAMTFKVELAEMEDGHHPSFNTCEEGKFTLDGFVDFSGSSRFVHLRKPNADIFRFALAIAQAPARQVVYIDNTPVFVQLAAGLGIRSIHRTDEEQMIARSVWNILTDRERW